MGVATDCSTATAEAPGYVAVTRIVGGARNGYCSMLRPFNVKRPISTMMMEITMATIGRRMKKFAMAYFPFASLELLAGGRFGSTEAAASDFSRVAFTFMPGRTL